MEAIGMIVLGLIICYGILFTLGAGGYFIKRGVRYLLTLPFRLIGWGWKQGRKLIRYIQKKRRERNLAEKKSKKNIDAGKKIVPGVQEDVNLEERTLLLKFEAWQIEEWNSQLAEENNVREKKGQKRISLEEYILMSARNAVFFTALVPKHFDEDSDEPKWGAED